MEFFKSPNINWMGKAKYFAALSASLLLIGFFAWLHTGGLLYGIDFRGGTLIYLRFAQKPPIAEIRARLGDATIQSIYDISNPASRNDLVIGLKEVGETAQRIDAGRTAILKALGDIFPAPASKQDFNSVTPQALAGYLNSKDPLNLGTKAGTQYQDLAQALVHYRDFDSNGILHSIGDISKAPGATPAVVSSLEQGFYAGPYVIQRVQIVGPQVGKQLRKQAVLATLYALAGMLVYIAFRFELVYGAAAVIAVFHDVLITLGFFCLFRYQISLTVIAALLTLVGYSMNDTIVIFDRVRENLRLMRREPYPDIVNRAINQTLSRTILTSGLTFLAVLVLYLFGGRVLHPFAFAMVVGVMVGTYSSFGIAAPIVVLWYRFRGQKVPGATSGSSGRQTKESAANRRLATAGRR